MNILNLEEETMAGCNDAAQN